MGIRKLTAGLSNQSFLGQLLRRLDALCAKRFGRFGIRQAARQIGALSFVESGFQLVLPLLQLYLLFFGGGFDAVLRLEFGKQVPVLPRSAVVIPPDPGARSPRLPEWRLRRARETKPAARR